jgi:hypothetical protein
VQYVLNGRGRGLPLPVPSVRRVLLLPASSGRLPVVGVVPPLVLDPDHLQPRCAAGSSRARPLEPNAQAAARQIGAAFPGVHFPAPYTLYRNGKSTPEDYLAL